MPLPSASAPIDRRRANRRRHGRRSRWRRQWLVAAAGAAMLGAAAYGVATAASLLASVGGDTGTGPGVAAADPVPSPEGVGDEVGTPARATARPERVTEPSAAPEAQAREVPEVPGDAGPPQARPAPPPHPPAAPDPAAPPAPARPAPPADLPAPPPEARPPGGFSEEDIRKGQELWQRYREWTGIGG